MMDKDGGELLEEEDCGELLGEREEGDGGELLGEEEGDVRQQILQSRRRCSHLNLL